MPGLVVDDPLEPGMLPDVPELESLGAVVPDPLGEVLDEPEPLG